jgi:hypothetical protein
MGVAVSSRPVDVTPVVNSQDRDLVGLVVDAIQNAVRATSGTVNAGKFVAEGSPDSLWIFDQDSRDEIDDSCTHRFGELLGDRSRCGAGDDEFVGFLGH